MKVLTYLKRFLFQMRNNNWHVDIFFSTSSSVLQPPAPALDGNPPAEQSDGAVVPDALPHAARLPVPPWVQRMVLQPANWDDWGQPGVQRGPGQETPQGAEAVPAQEDQGGRREADA